MTPEAAIYQFLSSFTIPAYPSSSVPDQDSPLWQGFPYITYDLAVGEWSDYEVNIPVQVWYRTESEAAPNAKVREMYVRIGKGGICLPCDNGMLWVKRGMPWAQSMPPDETDGMIKRRYVNLDVEFLVTE